MELSKEDKEAIYNRMSGDTRATPDELAKEYKCRPCDIMDAIIDVIKGEPKTYIPETSLNDEDDMVEAEVSKVEKENKPKKSQRKKEKTVKWSDVLGVKADKSDNSKSETTDDPIDNFLGGFGIKVEKINLDNHPELKKATDNLVNTVKGYTIGQEKCKAECPCKKQHDPISVDKLGALAYRLSKLNMSEDLIIKVLNITLGVPEPTIREALI